MDDNQTPQTESAPANQNGAEAIIEEFSDTCWCPQPDSGEDLLDANNNCRICGTHWS